MSHSSLGYGTVPILWNARNNKVAVSGGDDGALSPGRMVGLDTSIDPLISGAGDPVTSSGNRILLIQSAASTGNVFGVVTGRDTWKAIDDGPTGIYTGKGIGPGRDGNITVFGTNLVHVETLGLRGELLGPGVDPNKFAVTADPLAAFGKLLMDCVEILDDQGAPTGVFAGFAFVNFLKHIHTA